MTKSALVTGGCGFIGSHLSEFLINNGHSVTIIDNFATGSIKNIDSIKDKVTLIEADISQPGKWFEDFHSIDWVFHLAALADIVPSIQHPEKYYSTNVTGTLNVLQAALKANVSRFIYTASSSCYGIPDIYPTPETAPCNPQYPYALTKRLGEEIVLHWAQVYKLPAISLRLFNIYGLRSRSNNNYGAVLGVFLKQKLCSKPFTVVGDGNQSRDFTHVSDVVKACYHAAQAKQVTNDYFNVGSGNHVTINHLVKLLQGEHVYIPKRPGEPDCTFADISKINSIIGWKPSVDIKTGINEALRNISQWHHSPLWEPESIQQTTSAWFKQLG